MAGLSGENVSGNCNAAACGSSGALPVAGALSGVCDFGLAGTGAQAALPFSAAAIASIRQASADHGCAAALLPAWTAPAESGLS